MTATIVEKSVWIDAPARKVWEILVSPDAWTDWMLVVPDARDTDTLQAGSRGFWQDTTGLVYLTGTVTVLEPERRFVLELHGADWPRPALPAEVTYGFTLSESAGRTLLQFRLGDLSIDPDAREWRNAYEQAQELEIIKRMTEA